MDWLIPGLIGVIIGLLAFPLLIFISRYIIRCDAATFTIGGPTPKAYHDLDVIEYEMRSGGVWVKYHNKGVTEISMASFRVLLFQQEKLVDEFEMHTRDQVKPGETQECVLKPLMPEEQARLKPDMRVEVKLRLGYYEA